MSTVNVANIKSLTAAPPLFKNSSGIEKGRLIEAYCSFVGTGTVTKGESFNVSSITDNGTGDYTFVFTNNLDSTDYCPYGSQAGSATHPFVGGSEVERLVGSCRMFYGTSGGSGAGGFQNDPSRAYFIAIGGQKNFNT